MKYRQELSDNKKLGFINCPLDHATNSQCDGSNTCILAALKLSWSKAGFPTLSERSIIRKIKNTYEEFSKPRKVSKKDKMEEKILKLFAIGAPGLEDFNRKG